MKKKVLILIGIPGSGKSTWSTEFVKENKDWVRINRDDFRFMLKASPVVDHKVEKLINQLQESAILNALNAGFNVIIDNTNLKLSYINNFVKMVGESVDIEFKFFEITLEEALERNLVREKKVDEKVIRKMWNDWNLLRKQIFWVTKKLEEAEESGFTDETKDEILEQAKNKNP
jgi:predicted kinase